MLPKVGLFLYKLCQLKIVLYLKLKFFGAFCLCICWINFGVCGKCDYLIPERMEWLFTEKGCLCLKDYHKLANNLKPFVQYKYR